MTTEEIKRHKLEAEAAVAKVLEGFLAKVASANLSDVDVSVRVLKTDIIGRPPVFEIVECKITVEV